MKRLASALALFVLSGVHTLAQAPHETDWELVQVGGRVGNCRYGYCDYAWKVELKNFGQHDHVFEATIQWLDRDEYEVDVHYARDLLVKVQSTRTFSGSKTMRVEEIRRVTKVGAVVKVQR